MMSKQEMTQFNSIQFISFLYYYCAGTRAVRPITETAQFLVKKKKQEEGTKYKQMNFKYNT